MKDILQNIWKCILYGRKLVVIHWINIQRKSQVCSCKIYLIKLLLENLGIVTTKESQVMMRNSLNIAPWKKLCKPCKQKIARKEEDLTEEEQSQGEQDEDFLISFKAKRQEINEELKNFNISPLKSHSKSLKHIYSQKKSEKLHASKKWQITLLEKLKVNVPQNYVMKPMEWKRRLKTLMKLWVWYKKKVLFWQKTYCSTSNTGTPKLVNIRSTK